MATLADEHRRIAGQFTATVEGTARRSGHRRAQHDLPHLGRIPRERAIDRIYTSDVYLHGWDLARATGQRDA